MPKKSSERNANQKSRPILGLNTTRSFFDFEWTMNEEIKTITIKKTTIKLTLKFKPNKGFYVFKIQPKFELRIQEGTTTLT